MKRAVPLILASALFMEQMDSSVTSTSLPAIAADLGTSPVALKLALTAYLVSVAIFIPLSAWMADRFGARRVFVSAIAVFLAGSVACAASGSLGAFVGSRFLQGMGGAMMTPIARLILVRGTDRSDLINAMAWLTVPALIGPVVGPPLGGFITTYFSWHWIFLINIPIGLFGMAIAARLLPQVDAEPVFELDKAGFLLAGFAAAAVIFGFSVISLPALPPVAGYASIVAGMIAGSFYVRHARRSSNPVLNIGILGNPTYRATFISGSIFRLGNGALPFLLPLMLQLSFGMTPFQSGMVTFVTALGAIAMKFAVEALFASFGFRRTLIVAGAASGGLILFGAIVTKATPLFVFYVVLLALGFMRSLFFTGLNALSFSDIPAKDLGHATALNASSQQLSIAAGVAVAGFVLEAFAAMQGGQLTQGAYQFAFLVIGLVSIISVVPLFALAKEAGTALTRLPEKPPQGPANHPLP